MIALSLAPSMLDAALAGRFAARRATATTNAACHLSSSIAIPWRRSDDIAELKHSIVYISGRRCARALDERWLVAGLGINISSVIFSLLLLSTRTRRYAAPAAVQAPHSRPDGKRNYHAPFLRARTSAAVQPHYAHYVP